MNPLKNIFSSAVHLFYPHVCTGCGSDLLEENNLLCIKCIDDLPHTNFAQHANNPVEKIFFGRLALTCAHTEFYFTKGALVQHLIHQLKYKGDKNIGIYLGKSMGKSLMNSNRFNDVDALIPLPLYADKEHKRGYNQAAVICKGMALAMNIPVVTNNVIRQHYTDTQTRKHRAERWENVAGSFVVKNSAALKNKHLLLVDDVVTTGATLEACGNVVLQTEGVRLSIATLAFAVK